MGLLGKAWLLREVGAVGRRSLLDMSAVRLLLVAGHYWDACTGAAELLPTPYPSGLGPAMRIPKKGDQGICIVLRSVSILTSLCPVLAADDEPRAHDRPPEADAAARPDDRTHEPPVAAGRQPQLVPLVSPRRGQGQRRAGRARGEHPRAASEEFEVVRPDAGKGHPGENPTGRCRSRPRPRARRRSRPSGLGLGFRRPRVRRRLSPTAGRSAPFASRGRVLRVPPARSSGGRGGRGRPFAGSALPCPLLGLCAAVGCESQGRDRRGGDRHDPQDPPPPPRTCPIPSRRRGAGRGRRLRRSLVRLLPNRRGPRFRKVPDCRLLERERPALGQQLARAFRQLRIDERQLRTDEQASVGAGHD